MKHVKPFILNESNTFNVEEAMNAIQTEYSEMDVAMMLDDEILNWVEPDWNEDDEFESEYEWYSDFGHGEAEDVIVDQIVKWYETTHSKNLDSENKFELMERIREQYNL